MFTLFGCNIWLYKFSVNIKLQYSTPTNHLQHLDFTIYVIYIEHLERRKSKKNTKV